VLLLELVLGTPAVFAPSPATRAAVDKQLRLRARPDGERQLLYLLRGLMELCVYPPAAAAARPGGGGRRRHAGDAATASAAEGAGSAADAGAAAAAAGDDARGGSRGRAAQPLPLPWSCSEEALLLLVAGRDPMARGLEGPLALRLLQRLLAWDPRQRPSAAQALQHAYFTWQRPPAQQRGDAHGARGAARPGPPGASGVRALVAQQAAVLEGCSKLPLGAPGWC
jgi:hypothetical protein